MATARNPGGSNRPPIDDMPKAKIHSIGEKIESNGDFFSRYFKLDNGTEGLRWSKSKEDLEKFSVGQEVHWQWTAAKNPEDLGKIAIYAVRDQPSGGQGSSGGSGQRRPYTKSGEGSGKDGYWEHKSNYEEKVRDPKIEWQAYSTILSPLIIAGYQNGVFGDPKTKAALRDAMNALSASATDWFKKRNPAQPEAPEPAPAPAPAPAPPPSTPPPPAPAEDLNPPSYDDLPF